MKFAASSWLATAVLFVGAINCTATTVECPPPKPPAGEITCPSDYAAMCKIKDGVVHGSCILPPRPLRTSSDRRAFIGELLGRRKWSVNNSAATTGTTGMSTGASGTTTDGSIAGSATLSEADDVLRADGFVDEDGARIKVKLPNMDDASPYLHLPERK